MKILKRIVAALVVIAIFAGGCGMLNRLTVSDEAVYSRLMMHEFYNQENIDTLIVGASHCFQGIDPAGISRITGTNAFCASSASQRPDATLALVKEAIGLYDIDHIYVELSHSIAAKTGNLKDRTNLKSTWLVYDYMKPSLNRCRFILGASAPKYYVNSFFPARRDWKQLLDGQHLRHVWEVRRSDAYQSYAYDYARHDTEWYVGNGYVQSNVVMEESNFFYLENNEPFDVSSISGDWMRIIREIMDVCRENNVKLTFFAVPLSNFMLAAEGNYDEYIAWIQNFLSGSGVEFVDFNLLTEDVFPYEPGNFLNEDHLNLYGSQKFTEILGAYMVGTLPDDAFAPSVSEKLAEREPVYHGIYAFEDYSGEIPMVHYRLVANHGECFRYRIEVQAKGGKSVLVQDFDENTSFSLPKDEHGTIRVSFCPADAPDQVHTVERSY